MKFSPRYPFYVAVGSAMQDGDGVHYVFMQKPNRKFDVLGANELADICQRCDEMLSNKLLTGENRAKIIGQRKLAVKAGIMLKHFFDAPLSAAFSASAYQPDAPLTTAQQQAVSPVFSSLMGKLCPTSLTRPPRHQP